MVPTCASFFQVADPSTEATHEEPSLALPKDFLKRFHTHLSQTLVLEAPNGELWKAHVEADTQKQLRITSGWKHVAEYLHVQSGDLLVFDLVSKGHFRVYIYEGEDMCEKDLSILKRRKACDMNDISGAPTTESFASVKQEKGEVMLTCKGHTSLGVCNGVYIMEKDTHLISNTTPNLSPKLELNKIDFIDTCKVHGASKWIGKNDPLQIVPYHNSSTIKRPTKKCVTLTDLHKILPNFHEKTQIAFKKALSYSTDDPFTIVLMMHSSVCRGFKVAIPRPFAKQHMSAEPEHVALIDMENKAWSVTWLGHDNQDGAFSGGWRHFAADHNLKCGDICIFEKGSTKALSTFRVHIFKVDKADGPMIQQTIPSKLSNVIARGFK